MGYTECDCGRRFENNRAFLVHRAFTHGDNVEWGRGEGIRIKEMSKELRDAGLVGFKVRSTNINKKPLEEALKLTQGARQEAYGHPKENFGNIAKGWSVVLGCDVTPEQVAMCMIWTKVCREVNKPDFDNEVDMAGYVNTLHMCKEVE